MYRQHGQAGHLFDPGIGGALHGFHNLKDVVSRCQQLIQVIAEHLDAEVGTHAGDQFVETHLDGLGELILVAGKHFHRFCHFRHQFILGFVGIRPLVAGL